MALDLLGPLCYPMESVVEEGGEVELTLALGLSIGGSTPNAATKDLAGDGEEDPGGSSSSSASSSSSRRPPQTFVHIDIGDATALEQRRRREIHALRRREARRKRQEKKQQQKRGVCPAASGLCGASLPMERIRSPRERLAVGEWGRGTRIRDREARAGENECYDLKHKLSCGPNAGHHRDALSVPTSHSNHSNANRVSFGTQSLSFVPLSSRHLQYLPVSNGFGITSVPAPSPVAEVEACQVFQPYLSSIREPTEGGCPPRSSAVEANGESTGAAGAAPSWTGSRGSSNSPGSCGHRSGSVGEDNRSNNSDDESHHLGKLQKTCKLPTLQSNIAEVSSHVTLELNATTGQPSSTPSPSPITTDNKVVADNSSHQRASPPRLPLMPCVSTTGNGPNGRTIKGVLYRYSGTQVSIFCACHGSSFSPAGFVEHAGGTDVSHPLRQIKVVSLRRR